MAQIKCLVPTRPLTNKDNILKNDCINPIADHRTNECSLPSKD